MLPKAYYVHVSMWQAVVPPEEPHALPHLKDFQTMTHLQSPCPCPVRVGLAQSAEGILKLGRRAEQEVVGRGVGGSAGRS